MKSRHPKNYTIIELINGVEYLVKSSDYKKYASDYPTYWKGITWYGSTGSEFEWKKEKGSIEINSNHILTCKIR